MQLDNLQSIFNARIFRIPDYQRGYSWGEDELSDLWSDIDILRDDREHYTGVLSVAPKENMTHIVDGQQRITTLIILIHVICDAVSEEWINGKEKVDYVKKYLHYRTGKQGEITEVIFGYEKDNPSHSYFKTKILGLPDTDNVAPHTLYTRNLEYAKQFFTDKVKRLDFKQLERLLKKITEQLMFNYYKIDDELNEFVAYETMNNRGKRLSNLELLKNRLIYLSTLLPDNDEGEKKDLRLQINNAWKTVYEYLGKAPEKPLSDNDFLRDHWIINFRYDRVESEAYKGFLLDEHFTAKNVLDGELTLKNIRDYIQDIQQVVKSYYHMHNPQQSDCSEDVKKWLVKLKRLGFGSFGPLITSILSKEPPEEQEMIPVLKHMERFVFVVLDLKFRNNTYKNGSIYKITRQFHKDAIPLKAVHDQLSAVSPQVDSKFSKDKFSDIVYDRYEEGFYRWKGLKYFLYEYECSLQEKKHDGATKVIWENIKDETIEHIYPQTPSDGWGSFNTDENRKHLNDLGNLLLLPNKQNATLQNKSFKEKRDGATHGYRSSSYSAIEVAREEDWTPETIAQRTEHLLDFLMTRWELAEEE